MKLIRIVIWFLLAWFLLWAGKWLYILYKSTESFLPDVEIPLVLQTGYKYHFEYIPPKARLKEQEWLLDIEGISFNKGYETYVKDLMLNNNFDINKFREGYLYPAPIIKTKIKDLETGKIYEKKISFQKLSSSYVCNKELQDIWCHRYKVSLDGEQWMEFYPNKKYLIDIEVIYSEPKQAELKSKLILGGGRFKRAYQF